MYTAHMKIGLILLLIGVICIIVTLGTCLAKKCKSRNLRRKKLCTLSGSGNMDCYLTDGKILCDETIQTEILKGKL